MLGILLLRLLFVPFRLVNWLICLINQVFRGLFLIDFVICSLSSHSFSYFVGYLSLILLFAQFCLINSLLSSVISDYFNHFFHHFSLFSQAIFTHDSNELSFSHPSLFSIFFGYKSTSDWWKKKEYLSYQLMQWITSLSFFFSFFFIQELHPTMTHAIWTWEIKLSNHSIINLSLSKSV